MTEGGREHEQFSAIFNPFIVILLLFVSRILIIYSSANNLSIEKIIIIGALGRAAGAAIGGWTIHRLAFQEEREYDPLYESIASAH